jgi:hypothetical protein
MQLTKEEAQLVLELIRLWNAVYDNSHSQLCGCTQCEVMEKCGGFQSATFDSLKTKAEETCN